MIYWTGSYHCQSRAHCVACRTSRLFRWSIVKSGMATDPEFDCPYGITPENAAAESKYAQTHPNLDANRLGGCCDSAIQD